MLYRIQKNTTQKHTVFKRQLINNNRSYFYQQQRNKQRVYKFKLIALIVLVTIVVLMLNIFIAQAQALEIKNNTLKKLTANPLINGPQLLFEHPNATMRAALPVDMQAKVNIHGLIAYTEIKQVFINPHKLTLTGKYQFPLPENAAVNYLKVRIGDRIIEGKIMEKQAAKKAYIKAKENGRKASLVEQQRPNLFTNKIANIPPQTPVEVTIRLISNIDYKDGLFNFSLPLAITTRYQPTQYERSPAEQDSEFFTITSNTLAKSEAAITVNLNAGVAINNISSNSHLINSQALNSQGSHYKINLAKQRVITNKQFNLQWQLNSATTPQVSSFSEQIANNYYTLLTFFPPQQAQATSLPRDVIFIIDTSGSMQGASIKQAKKSLLHALSLLTPQDSFNIIAFESSSTQLFNQSEMVTSQSINKAQYFIEQLSANGGTEMYRPLNNALAMTKSPDQSSTAIKQIIFITDGAVANEFELMKLLQTRLGKARLFTIGIGAAPNGYFMKKAAQFGRGSYVFIQNLNEVQNKVSTLMKQISQPVLSDIHLIFDQKVAQSIEIYPKKIPDLYTGETLQLAIKSPLPINSLLLQGNSSNNVWQQQLLINNQQNAQGVSTLWARRKIADLLDGLVTGKNPEKVKQQVLATSITHQIISPYSSFIALEKQPDNKQPLLTNNTQNPSKKALKIAMPQTALGWQQQLLLGLLLLIVASVMLWQQTKSKPEVSNTNNT